MLHTCRVNLEHQEYDVLVGDGACAQLAQRIAAMQPAVSSVWIVRDQGLSSAAPHAQAWIKESCAALNVPWRTVILDAPDENAKAIPTLESLARAMLSAQAEDPRLLDRRSLLISVGGGIAGDITGFLAATLLRGVRWVNIPTTLLAMVDASVGGKTGVNVRTGADPSAPLLKNMLGAFHQPALVLADTRWLTTLPKRELACGLSECLKHAMIAGSVPGAPRELTLANFPEHATDILGPRAHAASFIAHNITLKSRVIERDERETLPDAGRALLNLGHTFAHAIESRVSACKHGEAVALGLIAATATSAALGLVPAHNADRIRSLVSACTLPTRAPNLPSGESLLAAMRQDKKRDASSLRLILPTGENPESQGLAKVVRDVPDRAILTGWDAIRA